MAEASPATKTIGILVEFNFEDLELTYPRLRFIEDGHTVYLIGPQANFKYKGKHGYPAKSTHCIDDVTHKDLDALVIPGGWAPDYWRRDERFLKLVRDMVAQKKPVAAICHGPWLLCSADVLKGRKATCFYSIKDDVKNAGATYVDEPVVIDGPVITSRVPDDLPQMCRAMRVMLGLEAQK